MTINGCELSNRGVLEIEGEDKASFLQGLITNDIHLVNRDQTLYATLLTPQGRFLYDFFIIDNKDSFLLDAEASRMEALLKKLILYKLRSKVILKHRPDLKVFALWGNNVATFFNLKEEPGYTSNGVFMDPRLKELGTRMITSTPPKNFQQIPLQNYDLHRLTLGIPEGGKDLIPEKAILLESGLDELNAISWTKGCYMGQELTARTKYRGLVRKRLFPVIIEGEAPDQGTEIFFNGDSVGEMRSHNETHGLALLRIEAVRAQNELVGGKARLKPYIPEWMRFEKTS